MYDLGLNPGLWQPISYLNGEGAGWNMGLGTRGVTQDGREYVFVELRVDVIPGDVLMIDPVTNIATLLATAGALVGQPVGVAPYAVDVVGTDYQRGWVQRYGYCPAINAATGATADAVLAATATPGRVDDAVGATIPGMGLLATAVANLAAGYLTYPTIGETTA